MSKVVAKVVAELRAEAAINEAANKGCMVEFIAAKTVAKLVKARLQATFPAVKFNVTSDHGSVDVRWTMGLAVLRLIGSWMNTSLAGLMDDRPGLLGQQLPAA